MKAFHVYYDTAGKEGFSEFVIVKNEQKVEEALTEKVSDFKLDSSYSKITRLREVSFSNVKLSQLSITEFLLIKNL